MTVDKDLPTWPSGESTWAPCAVEHDVLSCRGLHFSPGACTYQRIIFKNLMHVMNWESILGRKKRVQQCPL